MKRRDGRHIGGGREREREREVGRKGEEEWKCVRKMEGQRERKM